MIVKEEKYKYMLGLALTCGHRISHDFVINNGHSKPMHDHFNLKFQRQACSMQLSSLTDCHVNSITVVVKVL